MDNIMKYNRIQGKLIEIFRQDKISTCTAGENLIIMGTQEGFIHVASFAGQIIKSFKPHDKRVNDISLDNLGMMLLSCSDNGAVVLQSLGPEDEKESVVHLAEPLKAVCVEDDNSVKKERSFVVGTASGQLIYHRHGWFTQKNVVLFSGADSPVQKVSWRGNVIAWADASQVRLLDITTQSAVCYLACPQGVGPQNPYPCVLHWESETDLLVGWADTFRHLKLTTSSTPSPGMTGDVVTNDTTVVTVADWLADCIICGIQSFDIDNVMLLGYVPAEPGQDEGAISTTGLGSSSDLPELQIVSRATGELISADALPLRDAPGDLPYDTIGAGPWGFRLISDYHSVARRGDHMRWCLKQFLDRTSRGGLRGLSPCLFIMSAEDIILARVRDTDDRISQALSSGDQRAAVELALSDVLSLRAHRLEDVIATYLQRLLDEDRAEIAAAECARLLGDQPMQWERWVYSFALKRRLSCLAPHIPITEPRLPSELYGMVLDHFLSNNSQAFLDTIQRWGRIRPPLFDIPHLLSRLEARSQLHSRTLILGVGLGGQRSNAAAAGGVGGGQASNGDMPLDPWLMEAQAQLYIFSKQYEKALNSYLDIEGLRHLGAKSALTDGSNTNVVEEESGDEQRDFQHVFELIEKEELYGVVRGRVLNLIKLSRSLAGPLLIRRLEFFPVKAVVTQLSEDRRLLLWYLHLLFTEIPEKYNTSEYAEFHVKQVSLYAEFAPIVRVPSSVSTVSSMANSTPELHTPVNIRVAALGENNAIGETAGSQDNKLNTKQPLLLPRTQPPPDTDLLKFLKLSNFVPLELAWRECAKRRPPLNTELVYILTRMGNSKEALLLLLREIGDASQCIEFVEKNDASLWSEVVSYSQENPVFLASLLDHIGNSSLDATEVVAKIPLTGSLATAVPQLRERLLRIVQQTNYKVFIHDRSHSILSGDTQDLLQTLNLGQRRAIKVDPKECRCAGCGRPFVLPPTAQSALTPSQNTGPLLSDLLTPAMPSIGLLGETNRNITPQIWGNRWNRLPDDVARLTGDNGVGIVMFSSKSAFHQTCFDAVQLRTNQSSSQLR